MKVLVVLRAGTFVSLLLFIQASGYAQDTNLLNSTSPGYAPISLDGPRVPQTPLILRDSASGTMFYVESDGYHVSAIDKNGKLIWCTDLLVKMASMTRKLHVERITAVHQQIEANTFFFPLESWTRHTLM